MYDDNLYEFWELFRCIVQLIMSSLLLMADVFAFQASTIQSCRNIMMSSLKKSLQNLKIRSVELSDINSLCPVKQKSTYCDLWLCSVSPVLSPQLSVLYPALSCSVTSSVFVCFPCSFLNVSSSEHLCIAAFYCCPGIWYKIPFMQ